jgi:two-component system, cell cycle sensor histidine kinase and response regulator CckA
MKERSFESRVATIIDAVRNASPKDSSLGIAPSGSGDQLDALVAAIEDLLQRSAHSPEHVLLNALMENIPDKIYFKDTRGRFLGHSRSLSRAFKNAREAIGKTDFDLFTEEHARAAYEDEQRIISTGEPLINKEERETWPDGSSAWALTTKMPLRGQDGTIVGTFGISRDITSYKQAQDALQKSEQRYRLLFNSTTDMILVHPFHEDLSPETFVEANDVACELLGYSREELLHMSSYDIDAPEGLSKIAEAMARLRAEGQAVWEGVHLRKDGRKIPVEISNRFFELDGKPMILAAIRDITERRRLEESLEQERTLLQTLIDNLPDYVSVKDTESRFLVTNRANAEVMGLQDAHEAVGKSDLDFYPAAEAAAYLADEQTIIRTGAALINKEEESFDRSGHRRWTLMTKMPLRNAQGTVIGVVCTGRNITERKQTEERIQDLARFPDEDPNPVMRISPEGSLLYANGAGRSLLRSWAGAGEDGIPSRLMAEFLQAWAAGEKRDIEAWGGANVFAITVTPIVSRGYINLYGRDVTEEKSLAERLLQAQKMEAVGRLAGGIAHDFNNLLTVISGYCSLIQQSVLEGSSLRNEIDEIARAAARAATLTAQLLAFSRKQVMAPQVIDPNGLVRAAKNMLARLVGEDIELATVLDPAAGNITADPGQIEQVLMNLVANARDAMPRGGRLTIETSHRTLDLDYVAEHPGVRPGEYVQIAVSDTGQGMDREELSHIFEPFFTTKEPGKGTGLGLSTVYGIVEQSGGHITCHSEPGKGTLFAICLPRTIEVRRPAETPVEKSAAAGGRETILLVEDEETVRRFTQTLLEGSGYVVLAAAGGGEALAEIQSKKRVVDLLVTDVVMPRMNGKELAQRLTHLSPGTRVLFVSGYTGDVIAHHGMLDPGIDFLQKPFNSREFLLKVREILDRP